MFLRSSSLFELLVGLGDHFDLGGVELIALVLERLGDGVEVVGVGVDGEAAVLRLGKSAAPASSASIMTVSSSSSLILVVDDDDALAVKATSVTQPVAPRLPPYLSK